MHSHTPPRLDIPETVGPFRLLRRIGAGGMGVVYLGERIDQFTQLVAIKILHPQLFPDAEAASVQHESKVLAALDHSGIVRMLDMGITPDSLRYIILEYVDGLPLDQFCDQYCLSLRRRIELLMEVFEAVEHAHRRLVIHADLKPENILVTPEGKPRLLDFGVALDLGIAKVVVEPEEGAIVSGNFTALFASPEQRRGERLTICSDIYSLGVLAQLILAGNPAKVPNLYGDALTNSAGQIAAHRATTPRGLHAAIRGDIAAILNKATQSDPAQRFQSVHEMSDEFSRYLSGYPIQTRPSGWSLQGVKWVLRNRLLAGLLLIFILAVALSAIGVVSQSRRSSINRQAAQTRLHELVRLTDVLTGELYESTHGLKGSDAARAVLLESAHEMIGKLTAEDDHDPLLELELARGYEKLARIQLSQGSPNHDAIQQASGDVENARLLLQQVSLRHLPQAASEVARLQQGLQELTSIRERALPQVNK